MKRLLISLLLVVSFYGQAFAAIDFSGDAADRLGCGDQTILDSATSFTIGFVYDADSLAVESAIFSKYDEAVGEEQSVLVTVETDGSIVGAVVTSALHYSFHASNAGAFSTTGGKQVGMVVWSGGTTFAFYTDGSSVGNNLLGELGTPTTPQNVTTEMVIAGRYNAGSLELNPNGQLYQVDIWKNKAFTAGEAADYSSAKLKNMAMNEGATMSWWLDDAPTGSSVNTLTFKDRVSGITCTGVDADSDSLTIGETAWNYPAGVQ